MTADTMFQWLNSLGGSSLSSTANFHLALTDVNDNPPRLVKEYTGLFFCYPPKEPGSLIFEATDDDQQLLRGPHFTFSLGSESLQKDWEVSKINGGLSEVYREKQWWVMSFYLFWCAQHSTQSFPPCSRKEIHAVATCTGKLSRGLKAPRLGGRKNC